MGYKCYELREKLSRKCCCWILYITIPLIILLISAEIYFDFFNVFGIAAGDASLIILTLVIAYVAWVNLGGMNKTAKNDFLLRFDKRYCNKESLEAKTILHRIYLNTKKPKKNYSCSEKHIATISNKVKDMAKSNREQDIKDFMLLINFLDSLETIAYFVNNNDDVKIENIEEFLGQSIIYYYLIFITWIYENRRIGNHDNSYYSELEKLVKNLSKKCKDEDCQKRKKFQEMASNKLNELDELNAAKQICGECEIINEEIHNNRGL